jgi:hypothetical protein
MFLPLGYNSQFETYIVASLTPIIREEIPVVEKLLEITVQALCVLIMIIIMESS